MNTSIMGCHFNDPFGLNIDYMTHEFFACTNQLMINYPFMVTLVQTATGVYKHRL